MSLKVSKEQQQEAGGTKSSFMRDLMIASVIGAVIGMFINPWLGAFISGVMIGMAVKEDEYRTARNQSPTTITGLTATA